MGEDIGSEDTSSQYYTPLYGHPSRFTTTWDITSDSISSMTDSELSSLCSTPNTPQDEAIKLLASHGITMIPERPSFLPLVSLLDSTEAGKLALSLSPSNVNSDSDKITVRNKCKYFKGGFCKHTKLIVKYLHDTLANEEKNSTVKCASF